MAAAVGAFLAPPSSGLARVQGRQSRPHRLPARPLLIRGARLLRCGSPSPSPSGASSLSALTARRWCPRFFLGGWFGPADAGPGGAGRPGGSATRRTSSASRRHRAEDQGQEDRRVRARRRRRDVRMFLHGDRDLPDADMIPVYERRPRRRARAARRAHLSRQLGRAQFCPVLQLMECDDARPSSNGCCIGAARRLLSEVVPVVSLA